MNDTLNAIDRAANADDHWLFVAMLVLLILAAIMVWRWMVSDREKISVRLTEMTDRHITVTEKLSEVVANNTAVLHDVRKKL